MSFMELFKNICTGIVLFELFITAGVILLVLIEDRISGNAGAADNTGKHTFCALTEEPCIYASSGPNACDDCPAAQRFFYQEEQSGDKGREFQDERRSD